MTDINNKYALVRSDIKNGDIILFEKKGILPGLIKYFDHAKYTHVGIAWVAKIGDTIRVFIIDSNQPGVAPGFMSERISESVDFCRVRLIKTDEEICKGLNYVMDKAEVGIKYNDLRLLRIAIAKKIGWDIKKLDGSGNICSQFVQVFTDEEDITCYSKDPLITPNGFVTENNPVEAMLLNNDGLMNY